MLRDHDQAEALFYRALDVPIDAREAFLDAECGRDNRLRDDVDALLEADGEAGEFLESPLPGAAEPPAHDLLIGAKVGPYRIKRRIAAGGMGVVYEAEQDDPRRTVAVKVMREGITSESVLRRFVHEAQILSRMQHPNIAHVHQAGVYE